MNKKNINCIEEIPYAQNNQAGYAKRIGPILTPNPSRVLMRPFTPVRKDIAVRIINHILTIKKNEGELLLQQVLNEFENRHENIKKIFQKRFLQVQKFYEYEIEDKISVEKQMLIGSYFSHEYSPESSALFNPSIVLHPDQSKLPEGSLRFILSLRATGEGHISSITFRTGIVDSSCSITLDPDVPFTTEPEPVPNARYEKELFGRKLQEAGLHSNFCRKVVNQLSEEFVIDELKRIIGEERLKMSPVDTMADRAAQGILLLAESNYEVCFDPKSKFSQRILFPSVPSQSNGIEDARFVRFQIDRKNYTYYATYTAYDGRITLPQLLETSDFIHFKFLTLNGQAVQNKGMALFPRKINGHYAMLSRQDDENILLMYSDNIHFWQIPQLILKPAEPWELIKIGTCGSPIETDEGWLVLSHGVGPMRKYCIGAFLLDINNPSKVIGRLKEPLLMPNETERTGYVPNVVYTCGAMVHRGKLIIPYAMSDYASSFATITLDELFKAMK